MSLLSGAVEQSDKKNFFYCFSCLRNFHLEVYFYWLMSDENETLDSDSNIYWQVDLENGSSMILRTFQPILFEFKVL